MISIGEKSLFKSLEGKKIPKLLRALILYIFGARQIMSSANYQRHLKLFSTR